MADKQRVALEGSDISDAASAWDSVLASEDGYEADDEPKAGEGEEPSVDVDQDDPETDEEGEDEPESEEADEEDDDEAEEEGEDEDADQPSELDPEATVKVVVNGEEIEVSYAELKAGYSRTQDYTRKTQEIGELRRAAEQEKQKVLEQQQEWSNALSTLEQHIQAMQTNRTEAEWQRLKQEDELTYYEERDKDRAYRDRLEAIRQEQQRVAQELTTHQQQQLQTQAKAEFEKLLEVVPEWKDESARASEVKQINAYGQQLGFTAEELGNIVDHRAIRVLRDAAKYQQILAAKKSAQGKVKPSKVRTKSLKPGTPSNKAPSAVKRKKASQRLAKEQSVEAAASVFETLLDD